MLTRSAVTALDAAVDLDVELEEGGPEDERMAAWFAMTNRDAAEKATMEKLRRAQEAHRARLDAMTPQQRYRVMRREHLIELLRHRLRLARLVQLRVPATIQEDAVATLRRRQRLLLALRRPLQLPSCTSSPT